VTADTVAGPQQLASMLSRAGLRFVTEAQMQDAVDTALAAAGYQFTPQARLGDRDRPDFLAAGGIVLELKVAGTAAELERQVTRYAAHVEVTAVVVVTCRARHRGIPPLINGKPILVVFLGGTC
jgi:hypothetical protein